MAIRERKRLGELLLENGMVSQSQLEQALAGQKESGLKLGQYLIQSGLLKEQQIVDLVSRQLKIPKYSPDKYPYEDGASALVSEELAQKNRLVPLARKGNRLLIAMPDPMDINALDTVEIATNLEVEPVICSENDFDLLFDSIYGRGGLSEDVYDGVEDEETAAKEEEPGDIAVDTLQDEADQAPIIRMVNSILNQAVREKASDIHLSPEREYVHSRFRVDGKLRAVPAPPKNVFLPLVSRIKIMANMDIAVSKIPQDGRFSFKAQNKEFNVRVSSLPTIHGENLVLRLLDRNAHGLTLPELGLAEADMAKIRRAVEKPYGLIVSAGPTGSGKTTTLYSILRHINRPDINIITLEDPVEYRIQGIRQVQLNRRAGMTFASGLRSILRQDPDVILVGEIRDQETASIATQAALTGHKVLTTLHTNDAASAAVRLIDMGVEPFLVSSVMLVTVSQRLVRRNCPHCLEEYTPSEELQRTLGLTPGKYVFKRGTGCRKCMQTGFSGRMALFEVLAVDEAIQDLILKRASAREITRAALASKHMRLLRADALTKAVRGLTTLEEAATAVMS
ncbi:MAG TPA: GspE/PulE family protein [Desulfovibrio sp.]|uniref:GspE/PulE family protein n=1 Tax=Desulfovibrio sp. TaxID=885 RepID=UPI002C38A2D2|nr:GspE/PulE family protein [Desulfovibrio sp.]HMM37475.1 GspE/PulE family protein [Desulfovibrio sp.]